MKAFHFALAATAAASYLVVSVDVAEAQARGGRSGGGVNVSRSFSTGNAGRSTLRSVPTTRSVVSNPSRLATGGNAIKSNNLQQQQATVRSLPPGNRVTQQTQQLQQPPRQPLRTTTTSAPVNSNQGSNGQRPVGSNIARNQGGQAFAPQLRSSLGANFPKASAGGSFLRNASLPVRNAAIGNNLQRSRIGLPLNLAPRLSLNKVVPVASHKSWRPFVQRHWKRTFFWVALAGIGYVTVPEFGYERFVTFVERDEPDYAGAVQWLNQCATIEEGAEIPRIAAPANLVVQPTVTVAPAAELDERFNRFVNRRWNSAYVWVAIPRVGNVTVPQTVADQVKSHMATNPPNFEAMLQVLEEAAAADTVVAEAPLVETPTAQ